MIVWDLELRQGTKSASATKGSRKDFEKLTSSQLSQNVSCRTRSASSRKSGSHNLIIAKPGPSHQMRGSRKEFSRRTSSYHGQKQRVATMVPPCGVLQETVCTAHAGIPRVTALKTWRESLTAARHGWSQYRYFCSGPAMRMPQTSFGGAEAWSEEPKRSNEILWRWNTCMEHACKTRKRESVSCVSFCKHQSLPIKQTHKIRCLLQLLPSHTPVFGLGSRKVSAESALFQAGPKPVDEADCDNDATPDALPRNFSFHFNQKACHEIMSRVQTSGPS